MNKTQIRILENLYYGYDNSLMSWSTTSFSGRRYSSGLRDISQAIKLEKAGAIKILERNHRVDRIYAEGNVYCITEISMSITSVGKTMFENKKKLAEKRGNERR